jgi:hypothetical protein
MGNGVTDHTDLTMDVLLHNLRLRVILHEGKFDLTVT